MNKYGAIGLVVVVALGGGIIYRNFFLAQSSLPVTTGKVKEFTITAVKDAWLFEPEEIEVDRGDKIILKVVNEDDYDHGIGIDAFGISQRMPANETITIEFVATQPGEFPFFCSVPCGDGEYEGKNRTHFDMIGRIKVKDLVNPQ